MGKGGREVGVDAIGESKGEGHGGGGGGRLFTHTEKSMATTK